MKTKLKKNLICVFSLTLIFIFLFSNTAYGNNNNIYLNPEQKLEQIKNEQEKTKNQINLSKQKEKEFQTQVNNVEGEINEIQADLDDHLAKLDELNSEIRGIEWDLEKKKNKIMLLENELREKYAVLVNRLVEIYKGKEEGFISILSEPIDLQDFINRWKLVNVVADKDAIIVENVLKTRNNIIVEKKEIEKERDYYEHLVEKQTTLIRITEKKRSDLQEIYNQKFNLLASAKKNTTQLEYLLRQQEAEAKMIEAYLASLREGSFSGKFLWPTVRGRISSGFGYRNYPRRAFHYGIDIAVPYGSPIFAAASGEVVKITFGWGGGYGNYLVIYHGGGYSTLYAHCSRIIISNGQSVKAGQVIAYIGSTGFSTGSHLHFEVRINGVAKNPLNYF